MCRCTRSLAACAASRLHACAAARGAQQQGRGTQAHWPRRPAGHACAPAPSSPPPHLLCLPRGILQSAPAGPQLRLVGLNAGEQLLQLSLRGSGGVEGGQGVSAEARLRPAAPRVRWRPTPGTAPPMSQAGAAGNTAAAARTRAAHVHQNAPTRVSLPLLQDKLGFVRREGRRKRRRTSFPASSAAAAPSSSAASSMARWYAAVPAWSACSSSLHEGARVAPALSVPPRARACAGGVRATVAHAHQLASGTAVRSSGQAASI